MLVAQARSLRQQARLAITLAWVAGYTNVLTVLACGTVTSHVTGNLTNFSRDAVTADWRSVGWLSFLLVSFIAGAILSGVCTEIARRRGWRSVYVLPIAVETLLLAAFAAVLECSPAAIALMCGLASLAMGLQNATITRISGGVVRTTHMTGVFTDIGLEIAHAFAAPARAAPAPPPSLSRLALLISIGGSFALGAVLGAIIFEHGPHAAMFPPVLFLLLIIFIDVRTPIYEIEPATENISDLAAALPPAVAVYRLRKDAERPGERQRLPDLLRWTDELPPAKSIIVLDLGDTDDLDENAALHLRDLVHHAAGLRRHVLFAGLSVEQREALAAAVGRALPPDNLHTDVAVAIAHARVLADQAAHSAATPAAIHVA